MLILTTLPLNTAVARFNAFAVVAGAAHVHACACSIPLTHKAMAHINSMKLARLMAERVPLKRTALRPSKPYAFVTPHGRHSIHQRIQAATGAGTTAIAHNTANRINPSGSRLPAGSSTIIAAA